MTLMTLIYFLLISVYQHHQRPIILSNAISIHSAVLST